MRLLLPLFLLPACGEAPEPPPAEPKAQPPAAPVSPPPPPSAPPAAADTPEAEGEDARAVLRRYYALIEAGDLEEAWAMRSGDAAGFARFRETFEGYASYRANVGLPSEAVESGGWLHVEVPVMITGRRRGGAPVGTAGSVSMRRAAPDNEAAPPRHRGWHIFTG